MISSSRTVAMPLAWGIAIVLPLLSGAGSATSPYLPQVTPIIVEDSVGHPMMAPFLGGFDVPRPQLVDIDADGDLDLFVQERSDQLIFFERNAAGWQWRTNRYQDLPIGEWFRFVDMDGDGVLDLLSEMPQGYARIWHNSGTSKSASFVALGDSLRDTGGHAILVDRQNIMNAVDIDCNGRMDLFIGRVQGTVDRFEEQGKGPEGAPRFGLHTADWEGIQILGGEAAVGVPVDTSGPFLADPAERHGANTIAFADIDRDGDQDLFWGDFFEPGLLLIRNSGTCTQPDFQSRPRQFPLGKPVLTSGYNAPTFGDVDADGNVDMILGVIGGAYQANATAIDNLYLVRQTPRDSWNIASRQVITQIDVGSESAPVLADLDGDGDADLLIGNKIDPQDDRTAFIGWFENTGTGKAPVFRNRGRLPIRGEFNYAPAVADLDGDGLPDLVIGTWRDRLQWYRNAGTRTAPRWELADSALVILTRGSNTTPSVGDLDGDGLLDLMVGEASGSLNYYRNVGTVRVPRFQLVSDQFQEIRPGRRSAPTLIDMDHDGKLDMLLGSDEGVVQLWRNATDASRTLRFVMDSAFTVTGHHGAMPAAADLRGNGQPIILLGANSGGLLWYQQP